MQTQPNPEIRHCRITPSATTQSCTVLTGHAPTVLARPKTPPPARRCPCHTVTLSGQLAQMSQMSQLSQKCDSTQIQKGCHTVTLSGQLAQCHRCHTFQLQKHVFSYDRCDIVTSTLSLRLPAMGDTLPLHFNPLTPSGGQTCQHVQAPSTSKASETAHATSGFRASR